MKTWVMLLFLVSMMLILPSDGGFGNPHNTKDILARLMRNCQGGTYSVSPFSVWVIQHVDCDTKIAVNMIDTSGYIFSNSNNWICIKKPKIIPQVDGKP